MYVRNENKRRIPNVNHVFRDRNNPLDTLNDGEIQARFRLNRPHVFLTV